MDFKKMKHIAVEYFYTMIEASTSEVSKTTEACQRPSPTSAVYKTPEELRIPKHDAYDVGNIQTVNSSKWYTPE